MKQTLMAIGLAAAASLAAWTPAGAEARVEIGVLRCTVEGGSGFIVGSTKTLGCTFERAGGPNENYSGAISKFGIDIGSTRQSSIVWGVLAPSRDIPPGALAGTYGGVSAEATAGVGLGANVLLGGFKDSIALQPVSVQAQEGLNIAAGIAELKLRTR